MCFGSNVFVFSFWNKFNLVSIDCKYRRPYPLQVMIIYISQLNHYYLCFVNGQETELFVLFVARVASLAFTLLVGSLQPTPAVMYFTLHVKNGNTNS